MPRHAPDLLPSAMGMQDAKALVHPVGLCERVGGLCVIRGDPLVTVCVLPGLWSVTTALVAHRKDVIQMPAHITMCGA